MEVEYQEKEWENQTCNSIIAMTQFINKFQLQSKFMLNKLDEKLQVLENQVTHLESRVVSVMPNSSAVQEQ